MERDSHATLLWVGGADEPPNSGADRLLRAGATARITVTYGPASGRVEVRADDGQDGPCERIEIATNAEGYGFAEWSVPAWTWVRFRSDATQEIVRPVLRSFSRVHRLVHLATHLTRTLGRLTDFVLGDAAGISGVTRRRRLWLVQRLLKVRRETGFPFSLTEHVMLLEQILRLPRELVGDVVECGCWNGASSITMSLACELTGRRLFVCDSFEGLPEPRADEIHVTRSDGRHVTNWVRGSYASKGGLAGVRATVARYGAVGACEFVPGYFSDTLAQLPSESIVFVYEDADLLSSVEDCLRHLWPRLRPGCRFFSDEPWSHDVVALFYDAEWWQRELGEAPPGFTGSECGLPFAPSLGFATRPLARRPGH